MITEEDKTKIEAIRGHYSKSNIITLQEIYSRLGQGELGSGCLCNRNNRIKKVQIFYNWYDTTN